MTRESPSPTQPVSGRDESKMRDEFAPNEPRFVLSESDVAELNRRFDAHVVRPWQSKLWSHVKEGLRAQR